MADKGVTEDIDSILVKGEVKIIGQEALTLHFTNKRKCGGGEIANILLEDDQATITFCNPSGMYVMRTNDEIKSLWLTNMYTSSFYICSPQGSDKSNLLRLCTFPFFG